MTAAGVNAPVVIESMAARGPVRTTPVMNSEPGATVTSQRLAVCGDSVIRTAILGAVYSLLEASSSKEMRARGGTTRHSSFQRSSVLGKRSSTSICCGLPASRFLVSIAASTLSAPMDLRAASGRVTVTTCGSTKISPRTAALGRATAIGTCSVTSDPTSKRSDSGRTRTTSAPVAMTVGLAASTSRNDAACVPASAGKPSPPVASGRPERKTSSNASIARREPRTSTARDTAVEGSTNCTRGSAGARRTVPATDADSRVRSLA